MIRFPFLTPAIVLLALTDACYSAEASIAKLNGICQFTLPGKWDLKEIETKVFSDRQMAPGQGESESHGKITYAAFTHDSRPTSSFDLRDFCFFVAMPIVTDAKKNGSSPTPTKVTRLIDNHEDCVGFELGVNDPEGPIAINGIAIRKEKRLYIIQQIGRKSFGSETWRQIFRSFKEVDPSEGADRCPAP